MSTRGKKTFRDEIAITALHGMLSGGKSFFYGYGETGQKLYVDKSEEWAKCAYGFADAMLEARKK
jgi:hypothetical protein